MLAERLKTIEKLGATISNTDDDRQPILIEKLIYIVNGFNLGWDARSQAEHQTQDTA